MNHPPSDPQPVNDSLDDLLRESYEYISDNGFTTRVLATLPRRCQHSWLRLMILTLATLAGTLIIAVDWHGCAKAVLDVLAWSGNLACWQAVALLLPILTALLTLGYGVYAIINEEK